MVVESARYAHHFESEDGTLSYEFPLLMFEMSQVQPLRNTYQQGAGMDFAYDALSAGRGIRALGSTEVRFVLADNDFDALDAERDNMAAICYRIGRGKLYTIGHDGTYRWCWARLNSLPDINLSYTRPYAQFVACVFDVQSEQFGEEEVSATVALWPSGGQSGLMAIVNPGNIPARNVVISVVASYASAWTRAWAVNFNNEYSWSHDHPSVATGNVLRMDTARKAIEFSSDGVTYVDDFVNYDLPSTQQPVTFQIEPGTNFIQFGSDNGIAANYLATVRFYPAYA